MGMIDYERNHFGEVLQRRRQFLQTVGGLVSIACTPRSHNGQKFSSVQKENAVFEFENLSGVLDKDHHLAKGYSLEILVSWGDSIFGGSDFDWARLTGEEQAKRVDTTTIYCAHSTWRSLAFDDQS